MISNVCKLWSFMIHKLQIYSWVISLICFPIDSIVKTLFMAFFNEIFSVFYLSRPIICSYSFANPKKVLFIGFIYFWVLYAKSYFSFFRFFFYLIDWFKLPSIVFPSFVFNVFPFPFIKYFDVAYEILEKSSLLFLVEYWDFYIGKLNWALLSKAEFFLIKSVY